MERLRPYRSVRDGTRGVADEFHALAKSHKRTVKRLGGVSEVWDALCPPGLIARTAIRGITRGVLVIVTSDAPTKYTLERSLSAGLDQELISMCPMTVRRVRVEIARDDSPEGR